MSDNNNIVPFPPVKPDTVTHPGLSLAALAEAKHLDVSELISYGCRELKRGGASCVQVPYLDENGATLAVRSRLCLEKSATGPDGRFRWRSGDKAHHLYGIDRLAAIRASGWVLLVEGESDCWTAWHYALPVLGVPGKATWKPQMAEQLAGLEVYVWQEPDAEDFTRRIAGDIAELRVIVAPENVKDISEAHTAGIDVAVLLTELRATAIDYRAVTAQRCAARLPALRAAAESVLDRGDPLEGVRTALLDLGYGGELDTALIVYLALTSRLLAMRRGAMPVHLLLIGPPSAGKSYTLGVVLALLPSEAHHTIDAASPRVLIYDDAELVHRVVVFGEADSLPAGEDNPAASAIRNLLQDHHLHYAVAVRDRESGEFTVREIDKPGPTTLVTTSTRHLGAQLDSRVFTLEVPDDHKQIASALCTQAQLELAGGAAEPPTELIALQSYLQALAPWDVVVPFAKPLAEHIASQPQETRIVRDFVRLLSLIKSCAVIRHTARERDERGRLLAAPEDYATVRELVAEMYATSTTGAGERVRTTVAAVAELLARGRPHVSVSDLARHLDLPKKSVARRVGSALRGGWLANDETRKGHAYRLVLGEPLPRESGLPTLEQLGCVTVSPLTGSDAGIDPYELGAAHITATRDDPRSSEPVQPQASGGASGVLDADPARLEALQDEDQVRGDASGDSVEVAAEICEGEYDDAPDLDDRAALALPGDLLQRAAATVVAVGAASESLIARRCNCTTEMATATLANLEAAGIVGPADGSKARLVLVESDEELPPALAALQQPVGDPVVSPPPAAAPAFSGCDL